jgi:hypothetical protein
LHNKLFKFKCNDAEKQNSAEGEIAKEKNRGEQD